MRLALGLRLAKRLFFRKKKILSYFQSLPQEIETLISILQNKLIYPNVMIMKQVPHYTIHNRKEKQKLELGCLPGSASLMSLA